MTAPADTFEYRRDIDHRYWIERDSEVYSATVQQDVLPGMHVVTAGDDRSKTFTDLDQAIAWAKARILEAADTARKEQQP